MSRLITTTGQNNWQQSAPMSEARRRHVHGKLQPMEPPTLWECLRAKFGRGK